MKKELFGYYQKEVSGNILEMAKKAFPKQRFLKVFHTINVKELEDGALVTKGFYEIKCSNSGEEDTFWTMLVCNEERIGMCLLNALIK